MTRSPGACLHFLPLRSAGKKLLMAKATLGHSPTLHASKDGFRLQGKGIKGKRRNRSNGAVVSGSAPPSSGRGELSRADASHQQRRILRNSLRAEATKEEGG